MTKASFQAELTVLINKHSVENGSNTPDFILSEYIGGCLDAFERATISRDNWQHDTDAKPQV